MRTLRPLLAGMALLALAPLAAHAQAGRLFSDSWFWGAKGGVMSIYTTQVKHAPAPLVGGEWLITRDRGALYLSFDQAFFSENAEYTVLDADTAGNAFVTGSELVSIKDMRRATAAIMVFPIERGMLRPYAGLGMAFNFIREATPIPGGAEGSLKEKTLNELKSSSSPILIGGAQYQIARFSVFGQASVMARNRNFLFNSSTYGIEGGVRYNVGSSRERAR